MHEIDTIKELAPAVFRTKEEGAELGASSRYEFMTTTEIIDGLATLNWKVNRALQQKSKKRPDTTKHMIVFRNLDFGATGLNGKIPEILFVNSHDRTAALNFHIGIFRLVCGNGLILADETFDNYRVRHIGHDFNEVKELIIDITENFPSVFETIRRFQEIQVNPAAQRQIAYNSFVIRYPEYIDEITGEIDYARIDMNTNIGDLLKPLRPEDQDKNLWNTFNILQEKLVGGDFVHAGVTSQMRKARPVTNIRNNLVLNKGLWTVANEYALN